MGDIIYREARIEEYEKIGKLLANSFLDYPFLTIIRDDLKKPDSYPAFVETLQMLLTRVYICLLYTSPSPRDPLESRMPSSA